MKGVLIKAVYHTFSTNARLAWSLAAVAMLLAAGGWVAAWHRASAASVSAAALGALGGTVLLGGAVLLLRRKSCGEPLLAAPGEGLNHSIGRILQQVATKTEAAVILANRDGRVVWVNEAFTRLTRRTLGEVRGKQPVEFLVGPETDRGTLAEMKCRLDAGEPYRGQILNYTRDGGTYQASFEALPIFDDRGRLRNYIAIGRDVTARVRAEHALREEEGRYRAIFEASTNAVLILDPEGTIIEVNPAACSLYGYRREEFLGLSGRQIIRPDYHPSFAEFRRKVAAGEPFHATSRDIRRDGTEIEVEVQGTGFNLHGKPALLAVVSDVTEQQRAQRELREYAEALQAANHSLEEYSFAVQAATQAKSEFLANMSHEIRTPMTAILGFAEVLRTEGDLSKAPPARIEAIDAVLRNGEHLLRLINDVLDLSKIEAGRFAVENSSCCPLQVVADVHDLVEIRARANNLPFVVEYASPIPETIQSDATRLRQILVNLLGNAVKFTHCGSVRLRVAQLEDADRPMLEFAVIDTGIGIAAGTVDTIFEPFSQAKEHGGRYGGTGLGLTISRSLAQLLGGEITVTSELGRGSTFRLRVPTGPLDGVRQITDPAEAAASRRNHLAEQTTEAASLRFGGRVLLAEDGPDNQRLIGLILRRAGAEVVVAENGQQAIERMEAAAQAGDPFDLILMDMQMPVLDGYQATARLRRKGCMLPIVALTAHAMKEDRLKCLDAGCNEYASKPINRPQLLRLVSHYLPAATAAEPPPAAPDVSA